MGQSFDPSFTKARVIAGGGISHSLSPGETPDASNSARTILNAIPRHNTLFTEMASEPIDVVSLEVRIVPTTVASHSTAVTSRPLHVCDTLVATNGRR